MFVGKQDTFGNLDDNRWARDEIEAGGSALVHYGEYEGGHMSFLVGKDMSYFDKVIELVKEYNPILAPS